MFYRRYTNTSNLSFSFCVWCTGFSFSYCF